MRVGGPLFRVHIYVVIIIAESAVHGFFVEPELCMLSSNLFSDAGLGKQHDKYIINANQIDTGRPGCACSCTAGVKGRSTCA